MLPGNASSPATILRRARMNYCADTVVLSVKLAGAYRSARAAHAPVHTSHNENGSPLDAEAEMSLTWKC